jgi:hypothetical protein
MSMRDIFDIISDQKTIHINIEGEVSSDSLFYDLEYINELTNLLLDNQNDVEFKIFSVKEYRDTDTLSFNNFNRFGNPVTDYHEPIVKSIEFNIDVLITNRLYNKFDEDMSDFINFFTKGAINYKQDKSVELFTIDSREEYMSRPVESARVNVSPLDYGFNVFEFENDWGIGSHPALDREHDADGDAAYAAEFRPTDFSNMFRNCRYFDLSRLD